MRSALVGGLVLPALLLLLAACGGDPDGAGGTTGGTSGARGMSEGGAGEGAAPGPAAERGTQGGGPVTRLTVPPQDTTDRGREIVGVSPDVAVSGGGRPVAVDFATWTAAPLSRNARLPEVETSGVGVLRWTDRQERARLIGCPRTD